MCARVSAEPEDSPGLPKSLQNCGAQTVCCGTRVFSLRLTGVPPAHFLDEEYIKKYLTTSILTYSTDQSHS